MEFSDKLRLAANVAAITCRRLARETASSINPSLVGGSNPYGAESEARVKAVLDDILLRMVDSKELSLEPGPVYSWVDLAYCKGGLSWQSDNSEVVLVEVKTAAKLKKGDGVYGNSITEIGEDVKKLHDAKSRFRNAKLVVVVAFVDYDAEAYDKGMTELEQALRNQLKQKSIDTNDIELIAC